LIIKILLVAASVAVGVLILRQGRSGTQQALVRLGGVGVATLAAVAVLFPDLTVWAAHLVGVKRGTDLVLYVFVMTFMFTSVLLFQRLHHAERQVIALARALALLDQTGTTSCASAVRPDSPLEEMPRAGRGS
jgi:hypothetical protein